MGSNVNDSIWTEKHKFEPQNISQFDVVKGHNKVQCHSLE